MAGNRRLRTSISTRSLRNSILRRKVNQFRRKKGIRKAKPSTSTSLGGLIATGVRTLTSYLPGQAVVRPLVDAVLKAVGFVTALQVTGSDITAELRPIGLSANIPLNFGNLMCECKSLGLQGLNGYGLPTLTTNYHTGRIVKMIVTAEPTAKFGEKSGDWAMAIVPVKVKADQVAIAEAIPNFEDLKNVPGAKYGPATHPLSVVWIPNVTRDSIAAMDQNFKDYTGTAYLMLAYSQEARSGYGNFSPDSFSVRFTVKTVAHFDERVPMNSFSQQTNGVVLQPNGIKPKSQYCGVINGRRFLFDESHVSEGVGHLKVAISKDKHPELFDTIFDLISVDILKDIEDVSVH